MYPQLWHYRGKCMPTYNYYCSDCDTHFSYFQKMSESPISNCENCDGKVKRLITGGTGLIFKGSGFYLTDYKNEKKSTDDSPNSTKAKNGDSKQDEKVKTKNTNSKDVATQNKEKKKNE